MTIVATFIQASKPRFAYPTPYGKDHCCELTDFGISAKFKRHLGKPKPDPRWANSRHYLAGERVKQSKQVPWWRELLGKG